MSFLSANVVLKLTSGAVKYYMDTTNIINSSCKEGAETSRYYLFLRRNVHCIPVAPTTAVICTDSQLLLSQRPFTAGTSDMLYNYAGKATLLWIPDHNGIACNE